MKQVKRFRPQILFVILLMLFLLGSTILAAQGAPAMHDAALHFKPLPPEALSSLPDFAADVARAGNPKLDSDLARLAKTAEVSTEAAVDLAESTSLRMSGNRVQVEIVTHTQGVENAVEAVTSAGGEVSSVAYRDTLIQGWLPVGALEAVATRDDIYYIRRPAEGLPFEEVSVHGSTTEGLAVINGPAWHTAGQMGSGVKVGIIDFGFLSYTSLLGAELPASVTVKNFVDGENDSQVDGTMTHGTSCAEIIHDIAPDAALYLVKIETVADLLEAVAWLDLTQQVDIISLSGGWWNVSPGDGTGFFAELVEIARSNGILWVNAAGNQRVQHWGGLFYDPDADNIHNFNGAQVVNYFDPGDGSGFPIPAGRPIQVYVRWDDWSNVDQDYKLHLVRWNSAAADWELIHASDNPQNGGDGQRPTEFLSWVTSGPPAIYGFAIERIFGTRNVNFEIFAPAGGPGLSEVLFARSLANLADVPGVFTVAALDVSAPYKQEVYSSQGPTNGPGGTVTGGFIKPDISAFANVTTESSAPRKFNGTSAAAPHVAGAAALVLGANSGYTPDDIQSFLEGRAVDKGSSGKDTKFGHGQLFLGVPAALGPTDLFLPVVLGNYDANELLKNGSFDRGDFPPWQTVGSAVLDDQKYHSASYSARLGGADDSSDFVVQEVMVPGNATEVILSFWYRVSGDDPDPDEVLCYEIIDVEIENVFAGECHPLSEYSQNKWLNDRQLVISGDDLTPLLGQTRMVAFDLFSNGANPGTAWVDDVSFKVTGTGP